MRQRGVDSKMQMHSNAEAGNTDWELVHTMTQPVNQPKLVSVGNLFSRQFCTQIAELGTTLCELQAGNQPDYETMTRQRMG